MRPPPPRPRKPPTSLLPRGPCKPLPPAWEGLSSRGPWARLTGVPEDPGQSPTRPDPGPTGPFRVHAEQVQRENYFGEPPWPRSVGSPGQSRRPAVSTGSGEATEGESEEPFLVGQVGTTCSRVQRRVCRGCPAGAERTFHQLAPAGHLAKSAEPWTPTLLSGALGPSVVPESHRRRASGVQ